MANTTPIHNQNTVDLAILLDDALSGSDNGIKAAAGGGTFSADRLNTYLIYAYEWVVKSIIGKYGELGGAKQVDGAISKHYFTISSSGVALNADYLASLAFFKTGSLLVYPIKTRDDIASDKNVFLNQCVLIEGGRIYVYERTSGILTLVASGTGTLWYFKSDRIVVAQTALATMTLNGSGTITAMTVLYGGTDYQSAPAITWLAGPGSGATATANLTNGVVTSITVTNGSAGYIAGQTPIIAAPGGTAGSLVAANTVPDTTLDLIWLKPCVYYAAYRACIDKGDKDWAEKGMLHKQSAYEFLPQEVKANA